MKSHTFPISDGGIMTEETSVLVILGETENGHGVLLGNAACDRVAELLIP